MKKKSFGYRLIPFALCAVIVMLILKLVLTTGNWINRNHTGIAAPPEVCAGEVKEKPADAVLPDLTVVSESQAAPLPPETEKPKASKGIASMGQSFSVLQQKETDIKRREDQLKEREERIAKIEKEVEQKLQDLITVQKEIQAYRTEKQEAQSARVRNLSKIYGVMKPKEAAKLMENLDDKLVMGIVSTMTADEAAAILATMEVKKAAKISEALSGR